MTPTPSVPLWTHSSRVAGRDSLFFTSENNRCDQGLGLPCSPFSTLDPGLFSQGVSGFRRGHLSRSRGSGLKTRAGTSAAYSS